MAIGVMRPASPHRIVQAESEQVAQARRLGVEIALVAGIGRHLQRDTLDHVHAVPLEGLPLGRIVREETDLEQAEVP